MTPNDKKIIASAYFDGALDEEERAWFEEELQGDASLRDHLACLQTLRTTLQSAPFQAPLPDPQTAWIAFVQKTRECPVPARPKNQKRPVFAPLSIGSFAVAAVALILWVARPASTLDADPNSVSAEIASSPGASIQDLVAEELVATSFQSGRAAVIWIADMEPSDPETLWK
jgi:anti-sigma-K factor RskA